MIIGNYDVIPHWGPHEIHAWQGKPVKSTETSHFDNHMTTAANGLYVKAKCYQTKFIYPVWDEVYCLEP